MPNQGLPTGWTYSGNNSGGTIAIPTNNVENDTTYQVTVKAVYDSQVLATANCDVTLEKEAGGGESESGTSSNCNKVTISGSFGTKSFTVSEYGFNSVSCDTNDAEFSNGYYGPHVPEEGYPEGSYIPTADGFVFEWIEGDYKYHWLGYIRGKNGNYVLTCEEVYKSGKMDEDDYYYYGDSEELDCANYPLAIVGNCDYGDFGEIGELCLGCSYYEASGPWGTYRLKKQCAANPDDEYSENYMKHLVYNWNSNDSPDEWSEPTAIFDGQNLKVFGKTENDPDYWHVEFECSGSQYVAKEANSIKWEYQEEYGEYGNTVKSIDPSSVSITYAEGDERCGCSAW